ncbi:MAG: 3D domain-containing protein [Bacillota bacterium]
MRRLDTYLWLSAALLAFLHLTLVAAFPEVAIAVEGRRFTVRSAWTEPEAVLRQAGVTLSEGDAVFATAGVRGLSEVSVIRGRILGVAKGPETALVRTAADDVWQIAAAAGFPVGPHDLLFTEWMPAAALDHMPEAIVHIIGVTFAVRTEATTLPRGTQRRDDPSLELGLTRVLRPGRDGSEELTVKVRYEDGRVAGKELIARKVVSGPIDRLIGVGTLTQVHRDGQVIRFSRALEATATAYTPGPESTGKWADGYTAIGLVAGPGIVAVDPKVIPLRTKLYVDGYGFAIAGDVGGAIKGNRVDVCFNTVPEAMRWGIKRVKVFILD